VTSCGGKILVTNYSEWWYTSSNQNRQVKTDINAICTVCHVESMLCDMSLIWIWCDLLVT